MYVCSHSGVVEHQPPQHPFHMCVSYASGYLPFVRTFHIILSIQFCATFERCFTSMKMHANVWLCLIHLFYARQEYHSRQPYVCVVKMHTENYLKDVRWNVLKIHDFTLSLVCAPADDDNNSNNKYGSTNTHVSRMNDLCRTEKPTKTRPTNNPFNSECKQIPKFHID